MTQPIPPITEDDIAQYLANSPDFFERHASLLAAVQLTSPHGGRAVSLQERQAEMLREKIKGLEQRIMEMVRNSHENASIAHKVHQWTSSLLEVKDPFDLPLAVVDGVRTLFDVPIRPMTCPAVGRAISEPTAVHSSSVPIWPDEM